MNVTRQTASSVAEYLADFRRYYPGILEWYAGLEKDFTNGRRTMFISRDGLEIQGLVITKNGPRAKLCHISVSPTARNQGIGGTLMGMALYHMVHRGAEEIRVTTSEEVFREHGAFFRAAGFEVVDWQVHRYRRNTSELIWKLEVGPVQSQVYGRTSHFAQLQIGTGPGNNMFCLPFCRVNINRFVSDCENNTIIDVKNPG